MAPICVGLLLQNAVQHAYIGATSNPMFPDHTSA